MSNAYRPQDDGSHARPSGGLREHAFDPVTKRRLFSIAVSSPTELPPRLDLPPGRFVCLLAWDARGASAEEVSAVIDPLIRAGASCFVCWGPDCERVHDIIDEMISAPDNDYGVPEGACIMTTWHDSEPLCDAIRFVLRCAFPNDFFHDSTDAALAISVASSAWTAEIAEAFDRPGDFVRRESEDEPPAKA